MVAFFAAWVGYAMFAKRRAAVQPSVLASTNRWRNQWMLQATQRENRIVDAAVIQTLSVSPSFFASTTILIIGGLLAILGTTDKASELVKEIPFAARTTTLIFDLKLALLTGVFVFAFFRFTWSLRQYTFGAILVGATPEHKVLGDDDKRRAELCRHAPAACWVWRPRPSTTACAPTTSPLRWWHGSFRRLPSWPPPHWWCSCCTGASSTPRCCACCARGSDAAASSRRSAPERP